MDYSWSRRLLNSDSAADLRQSEQQENDNHAAEDGSSDPEDFISFVVLFRKALARCVKTARTRALFQFVQAHPALHNHGMIDRLFGRRGRRVGLQAHLDLA